MLVSQLGYIEKTSQNRIRPATTYEAELWTIMKQHMQKVSVKKLRMSRLKCGKQEWAYSWPFIDSINRS